MLHSESTAIFKLKGDEISIWYGIISEKDIANQLLTQTTQEKNSEFLQYTCN